jgi:TetR/AcrR family transcriptional regulator, transcriptional repressor for nem operon
VGGQDLPLIIQAVRTGLRTFEMDVSSFLNASLQAGQIKDGVDLPALAATIVSSWEGALLQMKLQQSPQPLEQFIASFNGVFRNARAR